MQEHNITYAQAVLMDEWPNVLFYKRLLRARHVYLCCWPVAETCLLSGACWSPWPVRWGSTHPWSKAAVGKDRKLKCRHNKCIMEMFTFKNYLNCWKSNLLIKIKYFTNWMMWYINKDIMTLLLILVNTFLYYTTVTHSVFIYLPSCQSKPV